MNMVSEPRDSGPAYPHYRHNLLAFIGDFVCFRVGTAFLDSTTVLPTLVRQLTASTLLVGLVSSTSGGLWMLPQLVMANYVTGKERQKRYLVIPALVGRPFTWLLALLLFLGLGQHSLLTYVALILWVIVFWLCDGLASVPWFRLISKTIPPERRGRLFGQAQAVGGMLAVGAGFVVRHLLSHRGPPFPINYAWLFLLAGTAFLASVGLISAIREDPEPVVAARLPWGAYLPRLLALLRTDGSFRLVTLVRLLLGTGGMAAPFYILYVTEDIGLSQEIIGFFVSVQVGSGVVLGLLMGYIHEWAGSKRVIQLATVMGLMAPVSALLVPRLVPAGSALFLWAYAAIFVGLQGVMSAGMLGFMNFIMEIAPAEEEPTYVGLANTLGALLLIYPLLGGVLLGRISYPGLFTVTALSIGGAFLLAAGLREPRAARRVGARPADTECVTEG
jgi:MFS family permease